MESGGESGGTGRVDAFQQQRSSTRAQSLKKEH